MIITMEKSNSLVYPKLNAKSGRYSLKGSTGIVAKNQI
jgi:hypothetical protein